MSTDARVEAIRLLSDGRWHSGEALAKVLGVSRAAVWKRMQGLADWGLEVQAVRGRGYRLSQPLELLDATAIRSGLSVETRQQLQSIDIFPVLDSTNRWLMAEADDRGTRLCLAEYQTAGRGRRGRSWHSPFGANLYLSLAWCFNELPAQFGALGLAIGVAVADTLAGLGLRDHGLKWPNDVLWRGRKLGGILVEHRGESGGPARVIVGLGLNLSMSRAQARDIDQPWTTLNEALRAADEEVPGRNEICAAVVDGLVRALWAFTDEGFSGFSRRWASYDIAFGKHVSLEHDGQRIAGVAGGIDHDGALFIDVAGQTRRFLSGDISLHLATQERP